jgi:hypothetical protein
MRVFRRIHSSRQYQRVIFDIISRTKFHRRLWQEHHNNNMTYRKQASRSGRVNGSQHEDEEELEHGRAANESRTVRAKEALGWAF